MLSPFVMMIDAGSPECRANVETFLNWARSLGLQNPDIFEPDDLLKFKNQRAVIFGSVFQLSCSTFGLVLVCDQSSRCMNSLFDVARRTRGLYVPQVCEFMAVCIVSVATDIYCFFFCTLLPECLARATRDSSNATLC
jgi:hypothetical protein